MALPSQNRQAGRHFQAGRLGSLGRQAILRLRHGRLGYYRQARHIRTGRSRQAAGRQAGQAGQLQAGKVRAGRQAGRISCQAGRQALAAVQCRQARQAGRQAGRHFPIFYRLITGRHGCRQALDQAGIVRLGRQAAGITGRTGRQVRQALGLGIVQAGRQARARLRQAGRQAGQA